MSERTRCCCNCRHNMRCDLPEGIQCFCEVDGHWMGYIECMTGWCRRWASDRKGGVMTDLIDRAAAIDAIMSVDDYTSTFVAYKLGSAITAVKTLPSADAVEVRHGTWIKDRYNNLDYVCSECGEPCADMVMGKPRDRYCKWCGARMGGET